MSAVLTKADGAADSVTEQGAAADVQIADDESRIASAIALASGEAQADDPEQTTGDPDPAASKPPKEEAGKKDEETASEKWARLSEQDREIRLLKKKLSEYESKPKDDGPSKSLSEMVRDNPSEALDLVLEALGGGGGEGGKDSSDPPGEAYDAKKASALERRLDELQNELAEYKKADQQRQQEAQYTAVRGRFEGVVDSDPQRWSLVQADGAIELAMQTALAIADEVGSMPTIEEALDATEAYLYNEVKGKLTKYSSLEKLRELFGASDKAKASRPPAQATQATIEPAASSVSALSLQSDEERIAAAIEEMKRHGA